MATTETHALSYLTFEIKKNEQRIKRIRENPDPSKPKSNVLLYELERDLRVEQLEACKSGKPIGYVFSGPLSRALGMVPWDGIMAADRAGEFAAKYFNSIRKQGLPENTCDRCSILVPMTLDGDFPKPSFITTSNQECSPIWLSHVLLAEMLNIPRFNLDRHFIGYKVTEDDEQLQYVTEQYGELIEYVEKNVPGCRYDEDRLIEIQQYNRQYLKHYQELWKLKALKPCPLAGRESFREIRLPDLYGDPARAVEYMRQYVEEVRERAARGWGAAQPEERLRLLWSVAGFFYADPFSWLESRGVSIPAAEMTFYNGAFAGREPIWGDPWKGRKLTPLEEEARQLDYLWGRTGDYWMEAHVHTCSELDLDGIVYFVQKGCPTTGNIASLVAEVAEQKLGIPTLFLEGRMLDSSGYDEKETYDQLLDFIDTCLAAKEKRVNRAVKGV